MTRRSTTLLALILALSLGAPAAAESLPQGGGANNVVIVKTTTDGAQAERAHTKITQIGGPNVESANIAAATATDCTGCDATAVAVQVALVTGAPTLFAPANAAVSANSGCTSCGTFAYAWQYVVQVDGPAHLSPEGQLEVGAVEQQIDDAAGSVRPATLEDDLALQARLDALTSNLRDIIDNEVQQGNVPAVGSPEVRARSEYRPD